MIFLATLRLSSHYDVVGPSPWWSLPCVVGLLLNNTHS